MKLLSKVYKELGIAFEFPIEIKDKNGNETYFENGYGYWGRCEYNENGDTTYFENSNGHWHRYEYDENGNETYFENSDGYWSLYEYDENGNKTYQETSNGYKEGTKHATCAGKVVEVDGKKYKLTEL